MHKDKNTDEKPQWLFGNIYECRSSNEHCPHIRIPFAGSFFCGWPLKDTSVDDHHQPPCMWDDE